MKKAMLFLLLVVSLFGCVSKRAHLMQNERISEQQRQLNALSERLSELRNDMLKDRSVLVKYGFETETLKSRIAAVDSLNKRVSNISEQVNKGSLAQNLADDIHFLTDRMITLQEEFADNNKILVEVRKDYQKNYNEILQRLKALEESYNLKPIAKTETAKSPASRPADSTIEKKAEPSKLPPPTPHVPSKDSDPAGAPIRSFDEIPKAASAAEQQLYDNAKAAYDRRQFERAITLFNEFIEAYPKQGLVVNALYWIAESRYAMGDFAEAYRAFRLVASTYPKSSKAPDAIVKMALCNMKMEDFGGARRELNRAKSVYPTYERINLINRLLSELPG